MSQLHVWAEQSPSDLILPPLPLWDFRPLDLFLWIGNPSTALESKQHWTSGRFSWVRPQRRKQRRQFQVKQGNQES